MKSGGICIKEIQKRPNSVFIFFIYKGNFLTLLNRLITFNVKFLHLRNKIN